MQREYVAKYVTNNHPQQDPVRPVKAPLDFTALSEDELRRYRLRYLNPSNQLSPDVRSFQGFLLENNVLGERTESQQLNGQRRDQGNYYDFRTKDDLRFNVQSHFQEALSAKEQDVVVQLAYKARNGTDKFRVKFDQK